MTTQQKKYVAVVGIDHDGGRDEPGEPYSGPDSAVKWLLECGAIEPAKKQRGGK